MRGLEYTRRLRSYFRWLRLGTDDPRRLDPSPLIGDVRQSFDTRPGASLSSRTEPPSSTRTREASTSELLLAYIMTEVNGLYKEPEQKMPDTQMKRWKRKQTPAAEVGEETLPDLPRPPTKRLKVVPL